MLPAVSAPPPFVALGYLSGGANGPRRTQIRQVAAKFAGGGVAYRFVLGMPESVREVRLSLCLRLCLRPSPQSQPQPQPLPLRVHGRCARGQPTTADPGTAPDPDPTLDLP